MAIPATLAELELARDEARLLVRRRGRLSAGAALVPIPGADTLADLAVFANMLEAVSLRFGIARVDLEKLDVTVRHYVLLVAGQAGSDLIGKVISKQLGKLILEKIGNRLLSKSLLRFVPLAGQAVAAFLSYRLVVQLGESHIDHCYRVVRALIEQGHPNQ